MTITRNFKLCLNAGTQNAPYINVNQYDEGEEWVFDLYTEGGQKFTPSTGAIIGIKSDGNAILNSGTVNSDGQVVITETEQMTAASGLAVFELLIEGETHGTANFIVNVERRPSDDAEFSDSDLSLLQQAVDSAAEIEDLLDGQDVPTVITPIITDWLDENITNPSNPPIDTSLTVAGAAADAKKTGDEIADLKSAINTYAFTVSKNLYNPSTDIEGYGLAADGSLTANANRKATDFIYIGKNNPIAVKCETGYGTPDGGMFIAQYDENKDFIADSRSEMTDANGWKTYTFTRATYIRMSMHKDTPAFMLNYGTTLLSYEPYGASYSVNLQNFVDERILGNENSTIEKTISKLNGGDKYRWSSMHIPNSGACSDYEGIDGTGEFSTSTSLSELYAAWDALVTEYPSYITKTDLGLDQSNTYHLYKYSFVPEQINVLNGNISLVSPPKVLLGGSVHGMGNDAGDQPEMAFALLYLFRNICENWKTDSGLAYLRWHVNFEVLPVQNPWGFQNGSRRNSRQVDINRNFPFGWTLGTVGANDYGGASALSEAESQIIKEFVDDNSDAIFHLDVHTTGGSPEQAKMIYFAMIDGSEMCYVANDLVLQLSEKWDSENIGGLTSMDFHGYISDPSDTGNGQINQYVTKTVGVPSCIIEGFPTFNGNSTGVHSRTIMGMCMDELVNVILRGLNFFKRQAK